MKAETGESGHITVAGGKAMQLESQNKPWPCLNRQMALLEPVLASKICANEILLGVNELAYDDHEQFAYLVACFWLLLGGLTRLPTKAKGKGISKFPGRGNK